MNSLRKRSSFGFYFLSIYSAAGLLGVIMVGALSLFLGNLISSYQRYTEQLEPIEYNLRAMNLGLNEQATYYQAYLQTGDEEIKEKAEYLLDTKIPDRFERLFGFLEPLNDPSFEIKIEALKNEVDAFREIQNSMSYGNTAANQAILRESYVPKLNQLANTLRDLNTFMYQGYSKSFNETIQNLDQVKYYVAGIFLLLMTGFFFVVRMTSQKLQRSIKGIQEQVLTLAKGNLPKDLVKQGTEFDETIDALNTLTNNLSQVKGFSEQVGKGDFDTDLSVFNNEGELGTALAGMRQSLKEVSEEDKRRDWVNQGLARFLDIIRNSHDNLEEFSYAVISNLIRYINANQGGLFILEGEGEERMLNLKASYAYNRRKFQERSLAPGQGLVGQAYLERDSIYLKEIPENYVYVTSGLGEATPRTIYIQPLMVNEEIVGVMELASFKELPQHVQDFIKKVSESVASAVATAKNNERNRKILQESQQMAEQLRSQEEELRQNTEELMATQEEMERRMHELQAENESLRSQKA